MYMNKPYTNKKSIHHSTQSVSPSFSNSEMAESFKIWLSHTLFDIAVW